MIVRGVRRSRGMVKVVAAVLMAVVWARPAVAWTGIIDWPTFFRTGPGKQFVVLEELARGSAVEVYSCADQWCLVQVGRVAGYVDQANLGQQAAPAMTTAPTGNADACFESRRAGYEGGEVFRYCAK